MTKRMGILEQRRIEAEVIKPIYEEMAQRLGTETAQEILSAAIKKSAISAGQSFAADFDQETDLNAFRSFEHLWTQDGALEKQDLKVSDDEYFMNVTRCKYSEMYRDMGVGDIGHILSCHRDGHFCEGFDDRIKLKRSQTIMGGASHCDFRFHFDPAASKEDGETTS